MTTSLSALVAMHDDALLAFEHIAGAVALCRRQHVEEVVARLALGVREGKRELAGGDPRDELGALRLARAMAQEAAAEDHGGEIGLERERAAERLHDDHGLDRAAAEAAMLLGEGQPEQAELGVLRPQRAAEALGLLRVAPPVLEAVAVGDEPLDALLQEPLFVGEIEIHLSPFTWSSRKPRNAAIRDP